MDKNYAALHPGEFVIELRDKLNSSWEVWTRDDSRATMDCRFAYQKEIAKPGQGVRFFAPDCSLIEQFDKPAAVCEIVT